MREEKPMTAADDRAALEKVLTTLDVFLSNQRMAWVVEDFHNHETLLSTLRHVLAIPAPAMAPIVHTIHGARGILELTAHEFGVYREAIVDAMAEARREAIEAAAAECERYAAECSKSEAENPGEGWRDEAIGARRAREAVLALAAEPAARGEELRHEMRASALAAARGEQHEKPETVSADAVSPPGGSQSAARPPAPLDDAAVLERAAEILQRVSPTLGVSAITLRQHAEHIRRQPPAPAPEPDVFEAFAKMNDDDPPEDSDEDARRTREWFGPLVEALESISVERAGQNDSAIAKADAALAQLRARAAGCKKEERK